MTKSLAIVEKFATRIGVDSGMLVQTLKATVLKTKDRPATDEEMVAFLAIADKYGLDPWTKEIHAFVDTKSGGIVPIVGIDGWNHIANDHPSFQGEEVEVPPHKEWVQIDADAKLAPPWMMIRIHRSDRKYPTEHTEYLDECYVPARTNANGHKIKSHWQTHTKRALEHKTRVQGRRIAFGFSGLNDEDEAARIIEAGEIQSELEVECPIEEFSSEAQYEALLAEMARIGLSEETVKRNLSLKVGYLGELVNLPLSTYQTLMRGLAVMTTKVPADAPAKEPPQGVENTVEEQEAAETKEDPTSFWPSEPEEPPASSVVAAGERAAASAEARRTAKPITQKQVNLLYTQCTIHGVDERAQLHDWLREQIGVEHVADIPAARFDEALEWVKAHEVATS